MLIVYGLKNCDTCKKARQWLEAAGTAFEFRDLRGADAMDAARISQALEQVGADKLVNRRGTTWRKLSEDDKAKEGGDLVALLQREPALMKRPIFLDDAGVFVGFDAAAQSRLQTG